MTQAADNLAAVMDKIDTATDEVAKDLSDLRAGITTTMTQAEVDATQSRLTTLQARLEAMGKDPADPAPVV